MTNEPARILRLVTVSSGGYRNEANKLNAAIRARVGVVDKANRRIAEL